MQRKWLIAAATMISFSVLAAGLSLADDEEGPLHEIMEKVNSKSNAIKKAIRTPVAYKKSGKDIPGHTEELLKLAKEAKEKGKDYAKKAKGVKEPEKRWLELSEAFSTELTKFNDTMGKSGITQAQAKKAWGLVSQSCTNCHNDFRVEEE
jgi:cytochrome c556